MKYYLFIEGYADVPNHIDMHEADSLNAAIDYFHHKLAKYGYTKEMIRENITSIDN